MSENENEITSEPKFKRSPRFPAIAIDDAIDSARKIYRQDKRALTTLQTLITHMGYEFKGKGGRAGRKVAALKQYGLLDESKGRFRISDLAYKILEMAEDSPQRAELVKQAAMSPPIIRKIFNKYEGDLPSDATIRDYLLFDEDFNADAARDFIRVLRRTKELVNPSAEDYTTGEESEGGEPPPSGATPMQQPPAKPAQGTPYSPPATVRHAMESGRPGMIAGDEYELVPLPGAKMEFKLYLSQTKQGVLSIPLQITKKEWELLKRQIQSNLEIAEAIVLVEDEPPAPKPPSESQRQADLFKNYTTNPDTGKPYTEGMTQEQMANFVNRVVEAGKPSEDE